MTMLSRLKQLVNASCPMELAVSEVTVLSAVQLAKAAFPRLVNDAGSEMLTIFLHPPKALSAVAVICPSSIPSLSPAG